MNPALSERMNLMGGTTSRSPRRSIAFGVELPPQVVVAVDQGESCVSLLAEQVLDFGVCEEEEESADGFLVEGEGPGGEIIVEGTLLLVGGEGSVFGRELSFEFVEPALDFGGTLIACVEVEGDFDEAPAKESSFDGASTGFGDHAGGAFEADDPAVPGLCGKLNADVEAVVVGPAQQALGRVTPLQAQWGVENGLPRQALGEEQQRQQGALRHGRRVNPVRLRNKPAARRGSALLEVTYAMTMLTALGLVLLKLAVNATTPRQWTLQNTVTDAYLTFERAWAERLPFAELVGDASPWPAFPESSEEEVELGRLPGGAALTGRVTRTRIPDPNNFPEDGGSGTLETNPARMRVWRFQSLVTYRIGGREYVKARTVVRSQ